MDRDQKSPSFSKGQHSLLALAYWSIKGPVEFCGFVGFDFDVHAKRNSTDGWFIFVLVSAWKRQLIINQKVRRDSGQAGILEQDWQRWFYRPGFKLGNARPILHA
jgi:hypothetical protein